MEEAIKDYQSVYGARSRPYQSGKPTKAFVAFQKKAIREGRSTFFPVEGSVFNPESRGSGVTRLRYDKRYKNERRLVASSRRAMEEATAAIGRRYRPPTSWSLNIQGTDYGRIWRFIRENNIRGRVQMRVSVQGNELIGVRDFVIPNQGTSWFTQNLLNIVRKGSDEPIWGNDEATITFTQSQGVAPAPLNQSFLDGVVHCVLDAPLREAKLHPNNTRWASIVSKILGKKTKTGRKPGLLDQYANGVPINEFQSLADTTKLGFTVYAPLKSEPIVNVRPKGEEAYRVFYYINTRLDHVESATRKDIKQFQEAALVTNSKGENISNEEITEKWRQCIRQKTPMYYRRNCGGISRLITLNGTWTCRDTEMAEFIKDWMNKNGLRHHQIDGRKHPELLKFLGSALHFNMTRDFKEYRENVDALGHIDMTQAYRKFRQSKYYKGFVKVSDFRKTDQIRAIGCYRINEVSLEGCSDQVRFLNKKLKWLRNNMIYHSPELEMWRDLGATFHITHGAWGTRFDLEMDDPKWTNKTTVGYRRNGTCTERIAIPYYCKFVGNLAITKNTEAVYTIGEPNYFRQMAGVYGVQLFETETDFGSEMTMDYNRLENKRLTQVAAGITSYMRINIMEQLMLMDYSKLVRICTDGIYYEQHEFPRLNTFLEKDKKTLENAECESYLSGSPIPDDHPCLPTAEDKEFYKREGLLGVGGAGKTYQVAMDKGLIDLCVVLPTRKAQAAFRKSYPNISSAIYWDLTHSKNNDQFKRQFGVLAFDEISALSEHDMEWLAKETCGKHLYMGDPGFQTSPFRRITDDEKNTEGLKTFDRSKWDQFFDHYTIFTHSYRIQCDILRVVCKQIRDIMEEFDDNENQEGLRQCLNVVRQHAQISNINSVPYKVIDVVLGDNNLICQIFTDCCVGLERWRVTRNGGSWYNGDISLTKPVGCCAEISHASTIHSIQGETVEPPSKVIILVDGLRNMEVVYTAVSRARKMSQIWLVE